VKYPLFTIASDGTALTRRNRHRKTRAFSCTLLRMLAWSAYKPSQNKGSTVFRPIFLDFCGTESEHRAFVANLRMGRVASLSDRESIELLRSEPYKYALPVRCEAGVRQIVYYPELFDLEAKEQRDDVWLCVMPPSSLLDNVTVAEQGSARAALRLTNDHIEVERATIEAENAARDSWRRHNLPKLLDLNDDAVRYWALMAREMCVRLDARTRYPVPSAPDFRALLLQHFLRVGAVKRASGNPLAMLTGGRDDSYRMPLEVRGPALDYRTADDVGYSAPLALHISQDDLGKALADLVKAYYAR
jgi:hypothetical protein